MSRWTVAALAAATLFASAAFAEAPADKPEQRELRASPRYSSTAERWQGRPALRAAYAHPVDDATASEKVYEHVPAVNFLVEGQNAGGFRMPQF